MRPGDTIDRLRAYVAAGAHAVYAPGLASLDDIARLVDAVAAPVNVLLLRAGPTVPQLASVGVRRASTGGSLAWAAYGAVAGAAAELLGPGTSTYLDAAVSGDLRRRAFPATPTA